MESLGYVNRSSFITEEVNILSKRGYISKAPGRPFCVSPISCVPKKGGKLRLITDLRILNGHCSDLNLLAWLLEPQLSRSRAYLRQWQHKMRFLRKDQPDQSMRQSESSLQSGASVIRWTLGAPPLKAIADFLLYLFQDRKLQPGTIDGYRSAIADKLGIPPLMSARMRISLVSWIASTETDPRVRGGIPSWNLSLVLHQLSKAPFEPMKEATLKHLTFKTVLLFCL